MLAMVVVVVVVGLLVWCFFQPVVGRYVARTFAVVATGLGVGLLVWGIVAAAREDEPLAAGPFAGASYSLVIGSGAGLLTAGIVSLVLSCIKRKQPGPSGQP